MDANQEQQNNKIPQQENNNQNEANSNEANSQMSNPNEIDINVQQACQKKAQQKYSKKQLKKLQKKQKWQQIKKQKRMEQRQKQKLKRKLKRQQDMKNKIEGNELLQNKEQKMGQIDKKSKKRKQEYKQKMLDGQKVVIDLQFYDLMTQKQQTSLGKQLAYCHSVNRKLQKSFNFIITSATQTRLKFLDDKYNISNYGINIVEQDILNTFSKQKLVYLTGDAEQQLVQFDFEQVYIIGGIVDHNRLKNITINYANEHGIKARRLPMEGLRLKASVHLAVNHVWEWMLRYYNGFTWKQAIKAVIPQRKLQDQQKIDQIKLDKQLQQQNLE